MHTSSPAQSLEREGKMDSLLHSIRKPVTKAWKKPIVGPPPTRVYVVDPHGFRQLVQKLTGAPQLPFRPPPPPLKPSPSPLPPQQLGYSQEIMECNGNPPQLQPFFSSQTKKPTENSKVTSAPSYSHSWSSYPLLSPGAVSLLDQSTLL